MKRLLVLFFIVVVDLLGFGIIIPLFPYLGVRLGATPEQITPILGVYSLCQFIAAPLWGRLSDRIGRRPVLMSSMLGAAASYLILAYADSIGWLIFSRALGGFMAGNISAAMAYAADVTSDEDRARGLGMVGAAIGIGFMLGPALGGILAGNDLQTATFELPALVAAGSSVVAFFGVLLWLPESHTAEHRSRHEHERGPRSAWRRVMDRPALLMIIGAVLLVTVAHSMLESIIAIWAMDRLHMGPRQLGIFLFTMGAVVVAIQGGAAGRLARELGEKRVALLGVTTYLAGLMLLALANDVRLMIAAGVLLGIGLGMYLPSLSSLASKQADPSERGMVMGTYQSATSLARIIGPMVSGTLYVAISFRAPFVAGIAVALPALWLIVQSQRTGAAAREVRDHG
jgi:MFS family permease